MYKGYLLLDIICSLKILNYKLIDSKWISFLNCFTLKVVHCLNYFLIFLPKLLIAKLNAFNTIKVVLFGILNVKQQFPRTSNYLINCMYIVGFIQLFYSMQRLKFSTSPLKELELLLLFNLK